MITIAGGILLAVAVLVVLANLGNIIEALWRAGARTGDNLVGMIEAVLDGLYNICRGIVYFVVLALKAIYYPQRKLWVLCNGPETITRIKTWVANSIEAYVILPLCFAYGFVLGAIEHILYKLTSFVLWWRRSARSNLK